MIAEFTYTECTSSGPFKKETGFKVKSVRLYKPVEDHTSESGTTFVGFDTDREDGQVNAPVLNEVSEHYLHIDAATSHLGGFAAPPLGPFSSPAEFLALPKGFVFDLVRSGGGTKSWLLARLSTSGPANGRPGNPFHQGILTLSEDPKNTFLQIAAATPELDSVRPIDIFSWSGWLNPRGDIEVNASNLRSSELPHPETSTEELSVNHSDFVTQQGIFARQVFSRVAGAFLSRSSVPLPGVDSEELRNWVSVISHLLPPSICWVCGFGSTWLEPSSSLQEVPWVKDTSQSEGIRRVNLPQLFWNPAEHAKVAEDYSWGYLASKVFEHDLDLLVYDSINQIDKAFGWSPELDSVSYALIPLALAMLSLSAEDFGHDALEVAKTCEGLLLKATWPKHRGHSDAFSTLWEMLEEPTSLYKSLGDRLQLDSKLDDLSPPRESL
jgi:hypothetical protein